MATENALVSSLASTNLYRRWLQQKLIALSEQQLVLKALCDEVTLEKGHAKTASFVKIARAALPISTLTDGTTPDGTTFPTVSQVQVVVDAWGQYFTITDQAILTASHPLMKIAVDTLADSAARLIDKEIGLVLLAGSNKRYSNGALTRAAISSADVLDEDELHWLRSAMLRNGARPRKGRQFDFVMDADMSADLMKPQANFGSWAAGKAASDSAALRDATLGPLLGMNIIESNFLPYADLLGVSTALQTDTRDVANVSGGYTGPRVTVGASGGALTGASSVNHFFRVVRKSQLRGYQDEITVAGRYAALPDNGTDSIITFVFPSTTNAGGAYVYDLYLNNAANLSADATMLLVEANILPGATVTVIAYPTGAAAPPAPPSDGTKVHIGFVFAKEAVNLVALQNVVTTLTPEQASDSDPLMQRRKVGWKFMSKAGIRDEDCLYRWEGPSNQS